MINFQSPHMLITLLLLPLLGLFYYLSQRRRRDYAVKFTNLALLEQVAGPGPGLKRHIPPALYLCGTAILLISMARPQALMTVPRQQAAVILAIDISGSMSAQDMAPTRMEAAQKAATAFMDGLPDDLQVGLVAFRDTASTSIPLTRDHQMVKRGISQLETGGGTAIGEAMLLSISQLDLREKDERGQAAPALIVLLSDGESNAGRPPLLAARYAEARKIPIYTIGIGQRGIQAQLASGSATRLDENTLKAVAESTGGEYFYAAQTEKLTQIYENLSAQIAWVSERTEVTAYLSGLGTLLFLIGGVLSLRWFQQFP